MKLYTIILFFCLSWCFCQSSLDPKQFAETITAKELKESLYVYASDYFQGRETGEIGQKRAIDFLQNFYSSIGIPPAEGTENFLQKMTLSIKGEKVDSENVVAIIRGSKYPNEYIVISSHLDHIGIDKNGEINNGADDDGSGTVAMLELAEAFKIASDNGIPPKRSIIFLHVTGEEKGLLGSRYYTKNPLYPLSETMVNLNIDMIGRKDLIQKNDNYIYLIGSNILSNDLHEISEEMNDKYVKINLDYRYNDPNTLVFENGRNIPNRYYFRSDHYNFAQKNIPVIFYFSGTHEDYHRPGDTPDKILYSIFEKRTKLVFYTAWELANRKNKIKLNK